MDNDIFKKLRSGASVNMLDEEYKPAIEYLQKTAILNFKINHTVPTMNNIQPLENEFFEGRLNKTSFITPPFQIDFPNQMTLGKGVFVNHSLTCMAIGGINIGERTMIGPNVIIATDNHDLQDKMILKCKRVEIGNNVWIGAGTKILPGVHIGDGAVVVLGPWSQKMLKPILSWWEFRQNMSKTFKSGAIKIVKMVIIAGIYITVVSNS